MVKEGRFDAIVLEVLPSNTVAPNGSVEVRVGFDGAQGNVDANAFLLINTGSQRARLECIPDVPCKKNGPELRTSRARLVAGASIGDVIVQGSSASQKFATVHVRVKP